MKRLGEYAGMELENLTYENCQRLIDIECAHEGIPFLPPLPEKPEPIDIEADVECYEISKIIFRSREQAEAVRDEIFKQGILSTAYGAKVDSSYLRYIDGPAKAPSVDAVNFLSENKHQSIQTQLESGKERLDRYESDMEKYEDIKSKRGIVQLTVMNKVRSARDHARKRTQIMAQIKQYTDLADGNAEIGFRFLKKTNPQIETQFPELFETGGLFRFTVLDARKNTQAEPAAVESDEIPF